MSENTNADLGTAENNSTEQSNPVPAGLNEETLAEILRGTLFAEEEQPAQPEAATEGEVQTEVKDESGEEAPAQEAQAEEQVPQAEDGPNDVHSQHTEDTEGEAELPKGVQKRIDKLTAKRKQAEEEVSKLREEVEALKQQIQTTTQSDTTETSVQDASNPFESLQTKAQVDKELENARWLKYKCMENPYGFSLGEKEYSQDDVTRMLVNATKAIEEQLPKQLAMIQAREHIEPIAVKTYSWWSKPESKEYQLAQQVMKAFPAFKKFPDHKLFIGDYIRGFMAREAQVSQPAAARKPAPVQPVRPTATPARSKPVEVQARSAEDRFRKTTSAEDLAKVLLSKNFI
jgi:hypothetical protein